MVLVVADGLVFEVFGFCGKRKVKVECPQLGPDRIGVGDLLVDRRESQIGDLVGIAQPEEADFADPLAGQLAVGPSFGDDLVDDQLDGAFGGGKLVSGSDQAVA